MEPFVPEGKQNTEHFPKGKVICSHFCVPINIIAI